MTQDPPQRRAPTGTSGPPDGDDAGAGSFRWARQLGLLSTIPFLLGVSPLIGYFMGRWLDGRLGTAPVLSLVLLLLGFVAGIRETTIVVKKASRLAEEEDRRRGG